MISLTKIKATMRKENKIIITSKDPLKSNKMMSTIKIESRDALKSNIVTKMRRAFTKRNLSNKSISQETKRPTKEQNIRLKILLQMKVLLKKRYLLMRKMLSNINLRNLLFNEAEVAEAASKVRDLEIVIISIQLSSTITLMMNQSRALPVTKEKIILTVNAQSTTRIGNIVISEREKRQTLLLVNLMKMKFMVRVHKIALTNPQNVVLKEVASEVVDKKLVMKVKKDLLDAEISRKMANKITEITNLGKIGNIRTKMILVNLLKIQLVVH